MAQKNKNGPLGTQSSADAQRSEIFEASVLKSASMEAQEIVREGEKEARKIVEEARRSSVDTQLDAYRRAAKRAAALEAAVARRENRDRLLRYRTQLVNGLFARSAGGCACLCTKRRPMPPSCSNRWRATGTPVRRAPAVCWYGRQIWPRWRAPYRPLCGLRVRAVRRRHHRFGRRQACMRAAYCSTKRWMTALPRCARAFWAAAACACSKSRTKHAIGIS